MSHNTYEREDEVDGLVNAARFGTSGLKRLVREVLLDTPKRLKQAYHWHRGQRMQVGFLEWLSRHAEACRLGLRCTVISQDRRVESAKITGVSDVRVGPNPVVVHGLVSFEDK